MKNVGFNLIKIAILISCLIPVQAMPSPLPMGPASKTYAVFRVSYNSNNDKAIGGVAGTAFFVLGNKALTANHVLNKSSFVPAAGFELTKVFLVHEGEPAIELKADDVASEADVDRTIITIKSSVKPEYVYNTTSEVSVGGKVETNGFVASSQGPIVRRFGKDLKVLAVPHLVRVSLEGSLTDNRPVELHSGDVVLKAAPCYHMNYQPVVGISGGPVTYQGKVIGVNSFGDPRDRSTWAVKVPKNI